MHSPIKQEISESDGNEIARSTVTELPCQTDVDPDQTAPKEQSDQGLHCCHQCGKCVIFFFFIFLG